MSIRPCFKIFLTFFLFPAFVFGQTIFDADSLDISRFQKGTFFPLIWSLGDPSRIYVGIGEGAKYMDGTEAKDVFPRYRGHYQMATLLALVPADVSDDRPVESLWRGGGIRVSESGELQVYHKSRSMNGFAFGDGDLNPSLESVVESEIQQAFSRATRATIFCNQIFIP